VPRTGAARTRGEVDPLDTALTGLTADVDRAQWLLIVREDHVARVAMDLERGHAEPAEGLGLGQPDGHGLDACALLTERRWGQEEACERVGGGLEEKEARALEEKRDLRGDRGVVDGLLETLALPRPGRV